jgi:hypothetical protein
MEKRDAKRVDRHGLKLSVGDKIRVCGIPPDVLSDTYDEEQLKTRTVFEKSLRRVFSVKAFDENRVELHVGKVMSRPAYEHSIWLEPTFIELAAKSKKPKSKIRKKRPRRKRVVK